MKQLNNYILEKLTINKDTEVNDKTTFSSVVNGVNFEHPTEEDAKKLEQAFKDAGVFPTASKLDSKYHTFNKWFVRCKDGQLQLAFEVTYSKPYKKKSTYTSRAIDFDVDSFIAMQSGGSVIYKYEAPEMWDKVIMPIANFFGAKFNKDGEFLMPGAKSKWN